jgi:hypothetical protein
MSNLSRPGYNKQQIRHLCHPAPRDHDNASNFILHPLFAQATEDYEAYALPGTSFHRAFCNIHGSNPHTAQSN